MVLVSLAVAALVVLAVLLTVLQCVKVRRGRVGTKRAKRSEASGDSGEDSDYSSYDGEEEETRLGDTVMSDTSSVQVSDECHMRHVMMMHHVQSPRPPPRSRRPPPSVSSVTPLPPAPTLSTFRRPGPELVLRPPHDLASHHHLGGQAPIRNETARYEFPSFLRDLEARRREMTPQPQSQPQFRGQGLPPPTHVRGQAPPPPTHFVSDVSLTGARGKLASLV